MSTAWEAYQAEIKAERAAYNVRRQVQAMASMPPRRKATAEEIAERRCARHQGMNKLADYERGLRKLDDEAVAETYPVLLGKGVVRVEQDDIVDALLDDMHEPTVAAIDDQREVVRVNALEHEAPDPIAPFLTGNECGEEAGFITDDIQLRVDGDSTDRRLTFLDQVSPNTNAREIPDDPQTAVLIAEAMRPHISHLATGDKVVIPPTYDESVARIKASVSGELLMNLVLREGRTERALEYGLTLKDGNARIKELSKARQRGTCYLLRKVA